VSGVVFDSGALVALERGDRGIATLVAEARRLDATLTVPAGCVAQVWRDPRRQVRLATFLRSANVAVVPLDDEEARRVGKLLASTGTTDVVDAHVALCAHRRGQVVLTSDTTDLRRLGVRVRRV
jgi:predicted nucleic acid-binding protein